MKRLLLLVVVPAILLASGFSFGTSPQSVDATLQFQFPTWVAVWVPDDVTWDFSNITSNPNNPSYPPDISAGQDFPQYYYPTSPGASPYMRIRYWTNAATGTSWSLTIVGSGDPGGGILIGDIEYSDAGAGSWTALSTSAATLASGSGRTSGWASANQDWRVYIDGDEEAGNYSCTVTITMQTL